MLRRTAFEILQQWENGHSYADSMIDRAGREKSLSPQDRALLQAMVLGVLRHTSALDFWIGQLRDRKLDFATRTLLRLGLCQLFILNLPEHAAVNETVATARKAVRGVVNACLRGAQRQKEDLTAALAAQPLHVRYSHPQWLVDRWVADFGEGAAIKLMEWNQQPALVFARANGLCDDAAATVEKYDRATPVDGATGFYQIAGRIPRAWIEGGIAYFQDPATRHSIDLLDPQPGETVLDACAAPGGKACMAAAAMENSGRLLCTDSNEKRLPRLAENLGNLGVTIAEASVHDWTNPAPKAMVGSCDAVLVDVPCSNTGVLRRRVDARWRLRPSIFDDIAVVQRRILENAAAAVAAGGRLVYSTCSVDRQENAALVEAFAEECGWLKESEVVITPQNDGSDGAYAARLVRK